MSGDPVEFQRAVFGDGLPGLRREWLERHVGARLGGTIEAVTFEAGAVGAVFGLQLTDGREVVVKALRPGSNLSRLHAVVGIQNRLAEAGYGAAVVLDGPSSCEGIPAVIEERLVCTSTGDPHHPDARAAMARALWSHVNLLRGLDGSALVSGRPGWANWEGGAWPEPHDPLFDFSTPAAGFEWIDARADAAAVVLRDGDRLPHVIGHSDWVWQNVCIHDGGFVAGYDWDSLVFAPECSIVGLVAGAFTQGSPEPPYDPPPEETAAFLEDYEAARGRRFDRVELHTAQAAATWVRCYNARIHIDNLQHRGVAPPIGSLIDQRHEQAPRNCGAKLP